MFGSSKCDFAKCSPFKFLHNATHQENKHTYGILDKPLIHFRDLTMVHKPVEQLSSFCCAAWHIWTLNGQRLSSIDKPATKAYYKSTSPLTPIACDQTPTAHMRTCTQAMLPQDWSIMVQIWDWLLSGLLSGVVSQALFHIGKVHYWSASRSKWANQLLPVTHGQKCLK